MLKRLPGIVRVESPGSDLFAGGVTQAHDAQAFSTIQVLVPSGARDRAFAVLGVVMGSSTIVGQLVGGLIVHATWAVCRGGPCS